MTDYSWPQTWPWVLIIPVYLFALWFILGATVAFYYWLKKDNQKAWKWLLYSLLVLMVAGLAYGIWWGVESGKFFKLNLKQS